MKRKVKWIVLFCVIALVIGGAVVLHSNPHYLYILGESVGVNCDKIEMNTVIPQNVKQFTLEELKTNDRITFDQNAMLINTEFLLPEDYEPSLSQYKDTDLQIHTSLQEAYEELALAVSEDTGSKLYVSSAYRTETEQQKLYEEDSSNANIPGASEHQTGLALDVYVQYNAGFGFIKTDAGQYVNSNCWKYGFIIRYPSFGKNETGMKYEPWHIRYVGEPHAKIIYNNHLTLEEYIRSLENGVWYEVDNYLVSRQKLNENGMLSLPDSYSNAVISPDNTGGYVITVMK
uniref:M15 family metallopeptidase n=1 Tax=Agathobacter sp. TaxID=2021311 RepID=UPI004055F6A9